MRDPIRYLRKKLVVQSATDFFPLLKSLRKLDIPGCVSVVFLRPDRRFYDSITVTDGGCRVPQVVSHLLNIEDPKVGAIVLASDRTGEVPADRPDDEFDWVGMHEAASHCGIDLLDWFVVWGTKAFSVAEFAPVPAGW